MLAHTLAHHVAGQSMQMHRRKHRQQRIVRILRDHRRNHASENVARAAGRHSRITRRVHPGFAVRLNHQRAMSLEHDDQFMLAREFARHSQPIFLHIGNRTSRQPRHFSRMRSDHQHSALAIQFVGAAFERIQAIGIENHGNLVLRHQRAHQARTSPDRAKFQARSPARSSLSPTRQSAHPALAAIVPASVSGKGSVINSG